MVNFSAGQLGRQGFAFGLEVSNNDFSVLLGKLVQFFLFNLRRVAVLGGHRQPESQAQPARLRLAGGTLPAGTVTLARVPSMLGTSTTPPSEAVVIGIGTRTCRSVPSRLNRLCGVTLRKM